MRARFDSFSLPTDGPQLCLLLHAPRLDCPTDGRPGVLVSMGAVSAAVECAPAQRVLRLASPQLGTAAYQLPQVPGSAPLALLFCRDRQQGGGAFQVAADGQPLAPLQGSSPALLSHLAGAGSTAAPLLGSAVVLGSTSDAARTVRADVAAVYVTNATIPAARTQPGKLQALLLELADAAALAVPAVAAPPAVTVAQQPSAAVVGQPLQLLVTAKPSAVASGDAHR